MFDLLSFMKILAASAATTMKNTDTNKAETMVISLDFNPKITHKQWKEKDYSSTLNHKVPELDDNYTTHIYWPGKSRRIHRDMLTLPVTPNRAIYIFPV